MYRPSNVDLPENSGKDSKARRLPAESWSGECSYTTLGSEAVPFKKLFIAEKVGQRTLPSNPL